MITTNIEDILSRRFRVDGVADEPVGQAALRVLLYYGIFRYPLTSDEVYRFCSDDMFSSEDIVEALYGLKSCGFIGYRRGYWFLTENGAEVVDRRIAMEERGRAMWKIARRFGGLMRRIPFVRGVFISGQLSRYIADEESDIDYFILTEPNRLWLVRMMFVLFRRTVLLNNRKYFCANYYVTTDNLAIRERNIYTACEVASLKPLWNRPLFREFIERNEWVLDYYPNLTIPDNSLRQGTREGRSGIQHFLEMLIPSSLADRLDVRLRGFTERFLRRKFPNRPDRTYETALRCAPNESRAHPRDQSGYVLKQYHDALDRYGLTHDAQVERYG